MARITEPTQEEELGWLAWVAERPPAIRAVAERFDPWTLYRMKSTGKRVTVHGFNETDPVTLTVEITGEFNTVLFDRDVFGIDPDDLEPCDLPSPDECLGTAMSPEEVEQNKDLLRVMIRPDLWEMGKDGKEKRKVYEIPCEISLSWLAIERKRFDKGQV